MAEEKKHETNWICGSCGTAYTEKTIQKTVPWGRCPKCGNIDFSNAVKDGTYRRDGRLVFIPRKKDEELK